MKVGVLSEDGVLQCEVPCQSLLFVVPQASAAAATVTVSNEKGTLIPKAKILDYATIAATGTGNIVFDGLQYYFDVELMNDGNMSPTLTIQVEGIDAGESILVFAKQGTKKGTEFLSYKKLYLNETKDIIADIILLDTSKIESVEFSGIKLEVSEILSIAMQDLSQYPIVPKSIPNVVPVVLPTGIARVYIKEACEVLTVKTEISKSLLNNLNL